MFWGLVLEPSKKYTQKVDQTFHISQAALDMSSSSGEAVQLVLEYDNSNFVLATLSKKANIFQVPLDLIFKTGDEISFRTIGNGKVHLSGYHVLEDIDSMLMNGEDESDLEDIEETMKGKGKRKKPSPKTKGGKKPKLDETNEDESEDDDLDGEEDFLDDDSEDENEENTTVKKKAEKKKQKAQNSFSMDDDDDDDDDEDDEEEEEEDDEDDEDEEDEEDDDELDFDEIGDDSDDIFSGDLNDSKKDKANKSGSKKPPQTPNGKGKDKSSQNVNKGLKHGTPGKEGKTPKTSENKQKNEKKAGSAESTPQRKNSDGSKKDEKTPKSPKAEGSPSKKVLEGGVISEEIKVGSGPVAKPGKMASVYYVGTLASSKKEFDSVQRGGGFKFRIGRNEVIRGWDIGINGMKVGGKRKLTIPPHLAYGSKGSPPVIPPNSSLVFTIELIGLS